MKIQCLCCADQPIVKCSDVPEFTGQAIECPNCGFFLLEAEKEFFHLKKSNLVWSTRHKYWPDKFGNENKNCPTTKII